AAAVRPRASAGPRGDGRGRIGDGGRPSQRAVDAAVRLQLADARQADVARAAELLLAEPGLAVRLGELRGAPPGVPARLPLRQHARDLAAVDAIATRVGAGALGVGDRAPGHRVGDDLRELADAVVVARLADVERLVVHRLARRGERDHEGAR